MAENSIPPDMLVREFPRGDPMKAPEIWPVIHTRDIVQTVRCAEIAYKAECAGVFLISMHGDDPSIERFAEALWRRCPFLAIGANFLTLPPAIALARSQRLGLDATWTDRQEFTGGMPTPEACDVLVGRSADHLFFSAVAFKGQPTDPYPGDSARLAARCGLIPTTSGPLTGIPPEIEKIRHIRERLAPNHPLAIASGVTPENVAAFAPFVSHILVSTGISSSFHEFDAEKLALLKERARQ